MKIFNKSKWKKVKLGDVFDLQMGKTPLRENKLYWDKGEYHWISISDMNFSEKYISSTKEKITELAVKKSGIKIIPKNTVIMSFKLSIGKVKIVNEDIYSNEAIMAFIPKTNNFIDENFLYYSLKGVRWNEGINKAVKGLTLNKALISQKEIFLPNLAIQQEIASNLDSIADFLDLRRKQLNYLKELNKSLFTTMFGDPFSKVINKEEEKSFLKDITIINPSKKEIEEIKSNLEISFITMADISEDGRINVDNIKKLEDVKNNFTFFKENDVLFAKITPCMENGKGGVAKSLKNNIGFGTTEIHVLRPISNITNSQWIYHLTKLPLFRKDAEIHMTGSAGQKRVPTTYLANFKIKVPPIELQNKFAERIERIEKLKFIFGSPLISTNLKNSHKKVSA